MTSTVTSNVEGYSASVIGNKSESVAGHLMTHGDVAGGPVLTKDAFKISARETVWRCNDLVVCLG